MSYCEEDVQVVVALSQKDYEILLLAVARAVEHAGSPVRRAEFRRLVDRMKVSWQLSLEKTA